MAMLRLAASIDGRYPQAAFAYVYSAIPKIIEAQKGDGAPRPQGKGRHVSGRQICEGLLALLQEDFGCLVTEVLHHWGINGTIDIGNIVYKLIELNFLSASPGDALSDFEDVFPIDDRLWRSRLPPDPENPPPPLPPIKFRK